MLTTIVALALAAPQKSTVNPMFYNEWEYKTMAWTEPGKPAESLSVWGTLKFGKDGKFVQALHIGNFRNHHKGTFKIAKDVVSLTENGKPYAQYRFAVNPQKKFLALISKEKDGTTIFELALKQKK